MKAKNTPPVEESATKRITDLVDEIDLESERASALCELLHLVFNSVQPSVGSTCILDNASHGLAVLADIINDKIQAIQENADRIHVIAREPEAAGGVR